MNGDRLLSHRAARVLLVALFSDSHPAIGESHGISVLGGCLENASDLGLEALQVIDMYALEPENRDTTLLQNVRNFRPTIVGISVPYGSYDRLQILYPKLKSLLNDRQHLVIFGGPLPTYLPEVFLREVDSSAFVVQGEGDEAIVKLVRNWLNHTSLESVPNICYFDGHAVRCQGRSLVDVKVVPPPFRSHIELLVRKKAQIFVESSRGCSWAACTFCPRGLMDVRGTSDEYRRFPIDRLARDLARLNEEGVQAITFADEDLLGGSSLECERFVTGLEQLHRAKILRVPFDASMTVQSIYSAKWDREEQNKRISFLRRLKNVGLRKVFLGVESGSATQLARYGKGHRPAEGAQAAQIVRSLGITLEIGFIMFDPLCTLAEIEENIRFLQENDLAGVTSSLGSGLELRLQVGSRYLTVLHQAEQRLGAKLFDRRLDRNTLTYSSSYLDPHVTKVVSMVRGWNSLLRPLYYPLKSLSRYGMGGILEHQAVPLRALLAQTRQTYLERIQDAVIAVKSSGYVTEDVAERFRQDLKNLSQQILLLFERAPAQIVYDPIIASVLEIARSGSS